MAGWMQFALDLLVGPDPVGLPVVTKPPAKKAAPRPTTGKRKAQPGPRGSPVWQLPVLSDTDLLAQPIAASPDRAPLVPPEPASPAALPTPSHAVKPNLLRHTQATHTTLLPTRDTRWIEVAYRLDRAKRRSIGFMVTEDGLSVKAPRWVSVMEVNQALQTKASWILRKLTELQERSETAITQQIRWENGATLQLFGQPIVLALDPQHSGPRAGGQLEEATEPGLPARLKLNLPMDAQPEKIRDAAKAWLMRHALGHFTERLNHFAPQLAVRWTKLTLSNAGTRWGSAKADGSIRLHWRLIHFRPSIIDYVVVHELSHLRVMDHSPRFWDTVAILVPDYAHRRKELRTHHLPKWV